MVSLSKVLLKKLIYVAIVQNTYGFMHIGQEWANILGFWHSLSLLVVYPYINSTELNLIMVLSKKIYGNYVFVGWWSYGCTASHIKVQILVTIFYAYVNTFSLEILWCCRFIMASPYRRVLRDVLARVCGVCAFF